ncbi:MAG: hypothetical protein GTN65_15415, partial [Armatimonadetes bacterium]|nr:hypothetical protein [Armatimonadota bacterium]NIO98446.1 hypothetical protein [Armatimonadota bacterium]
PIIAITGFLALGQALFYREAWAGGFGWGLRFMLPALPGIAVLCAAPVEALLDASCRPLRGLLYGALGVG